MDFSESTKTVLQRIQEIDPENASKIMGYLLMDQNSEREMIRLAFSADPVIRLVADKVKLNLGLLHPRPAAQAQARSFVSYNPSASAYGLHHNPQQNQAQFLPAGFLPPQRFFQGFNASPSTTYPQAQYTLPRPDQRPEKLPEFCPKDSPLLYGRICENFQNGYCNHGAYCKLLHVLDMKNDHVMILNRDCPGEEEAHATSENCLRRLEMELIEILKCRRGIPVTTACLPLLYYKMYNRPLDAEAYLEAGQRRFGCAISQLVARMTRDIRFVNRPHGMQTIILAEDIPAYTELMYKLRDFEPNSCRIYLTFSSDSTFTDRDVHDYFTNFGPVQEVRIPRQEKRMYGFVTFYYPETVILILSVPSHHVIAGTQLLVKPYRHNHMAVGRRVEHGESSSSVTANSSSGHHISSILRRDDGSVQPREGLVVSADDGSSSSNAGNERPGR